MSGERGNNKDRKDDRASMNLTVDSLENLLKQYKRAGDPSDSPFADAIEKMRIDTNQQVKDATDSFDLQMDQNKKAHDFAKAQGNRGYQDTVTQSKENMARMHQDATSKLEDTRATSSDAAFQEMVQSGVAGLAASGGRRKKIMSEAARRQVGTMTLGLKHARDAEKSQLKAAERAVNRSTSESAFGLEQKEEAARLSLDQTKNTLNRAKNDFIDEQKNAQFDAMEQIRGYASDAVMDTVRNFKSRWSEWGDEESQSGEWNPWNLPFDAADANMGTTNDQFSEGKTHWTEENDPDWLRNLFS